MDKHLYAYARSGHLILTVNERLSRTLSKQYDQLQLSQEKTAWLRPSIYSLSGWLSRCHHETPDMPVLLNNAQLQHTWETIIAEDIKASGNSLLQVTQTAKRAIQAHQLLVKHAAGFDDSLAAEDHRAFLRWQRAWLELARQNEWHDPVELVRFVADEIAKGGIEIPAIVCLAGFDEIAPDIERLISSMANAGAQVETWQPKPCAEVNCSRIAAADMQDEISLCARWLRQKLSVEPAATIGVVVPQLESYQQQIENTFAAELIPGEYINCDDKQGLFNLSLGHSLENVGVVSAALRLLGVNVNLNHEDITWLLCTPYLGAAFAERDDRALLDRELRKLRHFDWNLARLGKTAVGIAKKKKLKVNDFCGKFEVFSRVLGRASRKQLPGEWAESFALCLQDLGWPGDRGVSSREYQAIEQFRSALSGLASLDSVSKPMVRTQALQILTNIVRSHEFQPEGKDAPIQVLGELESAGLTFDYLWVLGLHDKALPSPPKPNPFIPLPVQKQYGMKRADIEREHLFAEQVIKRLLTAAPEIVVSWPTKDQNSEQRPSPFITNIPLVELEFPDSSMPQHVIHDQRPMMEVLTDENGPPLSTRKIFTGGTAIIKDQALCPFRAFAHHRLKAEDMDSPDVGIDNLSRGTLVHTVLELFWEDVKCQEALLELDEESMRNKVEQATLQALDRLERHQRHDIPARQKRVEAARLQRIACQWLGKERGRGPFSVMETEKSHKIDVGGLSIRTRIDRVDRLEGGLFAVIDYKTGRPDPTQWLDARISEPQLPLYALSLPDRSVGAVMFAEVRSKLSECGFRGLAREVDSWPGAKSRKVDNTLKERGFESFDQLVQHWANALPALGNDFAAGKALVDPLDPELTCRYCDLASLCRVSEAVSSTLGGADD